MPIQKKPIVDLETGIEYASVSEAARALGLNPQVVSYMSKPQRFKQID